MPTRQASGPVIELAGLPGAGKTTLERSIALAHDTRTSISVWRLPFSAAALNVLWQALGIAWHGPRRLESLRRAMALFFMLRAAPQRAKKLTILDQGLLQKAWSLLLDHPALRPEKRDRLVAALAPFMADAIVWLDAPPDMAANRIAGRHGGTSRFDSEDGLLPDVEALWPAYRILPLLGLWRQRTGHALPRHPRRPAFRNAAPDARKADHGDA
ncbi:MAG: AAA family ATPase [Hyphomicrobiales bacterium]